VTDKGKISQEVFKNRTSQLQKAANYKNLRDNLLEN